MGSKFEKKTFTAPPEPTYEIIMKPLTYTAMFPAEQFQ
jgi:hypothetical protein